MSEELKSEKDFKNLIKEKNIKKIFVLSGENSFIKTGAKKIFEHLINLKQNNIFLKKKKLPEFQELKEIINQINIFKPDIIIAIGGGCVMDLAKISSSLNTSNSLESDILKSNIKKNIRVLAIPTTAGSGAEVTSNAVIYINGLKYSVEGESIKPDYFYLVPELLSSSGFYLDSTACFDAISQSVESMFSVKSNQESLKYANQGLQIILDNYKDFFKNKNISNSQKMLIGANFSGKAINLSKTIAPHALSYPFTYLFGVSHGHAVSLTFNEILNFNYKNIQRSKNIIDVNSRYQNLFKITKTKNISDLNNFFIDIKKDLQLEQNLKKFNINMKNDKEKILSGVNDQRLKNNPIHISSEDIKKIFENMS